MVDTKTVSGRREFVDAIETNEDLRLSKDGAEELWRVWTFRHENGATDDVLVGVPEWFADNEIGMKRPFFFASVEHDDPDKGAVLFSDARLVDISIIENQVWDDVTVTETLETLDISDEDDYIDEKGKIWIPRSLMSIFEREDRQ